MKGHRSFQCQVHPMQGETAVGAQRKLLMLTLDTACAATSGTDADWNKPTKTWLDRTGTVQFPETKVSKLAVCRLNRAYSHINTQTVPTCTTARRLCQRRSEVACHALRSLLSVHLPAVFHGPRKSSLGTCSRTHCTVSLPQECLVLLSAAAGTRGQYAWCAAVPGRLPRPFSS